ncbi:hypothetical protein BH10ACI1_BH10ACI1_18020 [soil metagenome]
MNDFVRNFLTEWRNLDLPFENETIIAAVSGGADSVSLLLVLNELRELEKLKNRFVIAHFNHNLRGEESLMDAEFVQTLTTKFNFEFVQKKQDSKTKIVNQKGNLEQNARNARYEFLRQTAENLNAYGILTAHTLNDQTETFLINLIRGSGIAGLSGMKTFRTLEDAARKCGVTEKNEISSSNEASPFLPFSTSKVFLIRPFLSWATREDTENYCHLHKINFRYDTMNEDLGFQRVRIRKILIPLLKDFNPQIVKILANTSTLLRADFDELNSLFEKHLKVFDESELILKDLKTLSFATLRRGLQHWLIKKSGNLRSLQSKHFEAVEKLIFSRKSGKIAQLPNGVTITKDHGKLIFQKRKVEKS